MGLFSGQGTKIPHVRCGQNNINSCLWFKLGIEDNFWERFVYAQLRLTLCDRMDWSPPCSSVHGILPVKNTGVGCHFLLQGIFPTQGSDLSLLCLLHWQVDSLPLSYLGKGYSLKYLVSGSCIYFFLTWQLESSDDLEMKKGDQLGDLSWSARCHQAVTPLIFPSEQDLTY